MNVYEYLNQLRNYQYKVENARSEIKRLESLATSVGAIDYSRESIQNGRTEREPSYVYTLEQISEHREKLVALVKEYDELRHTVYLQIEELEDGLQAKVLYLRYLEFKNLKREIPRIISYSQAGTRNIYRAGIRNFKRIHGEEF